MEFLSDHARSICIEAAYKGCERNIRADLSYKERSILEKVNQLMAMLKTSNVHVFCTGHYVGFLEGTLKDYNSIVFVYTCSSADWNEVLDPDTYLALFMVDQGNSTIIRHEERRVGDDDRAERLKCHLDFSDDTHFIVDIVKITIFHPDLRSNILQFFSHLRNNACKVVLPFQWGVIFRGEHVTQHDMLKCYGSPFLLTYYCARKLQLV